MTSLVCGAVAGQAGSDTLHHDRARPHLDALLVDMSTVFHMCHWRLTGAMHLDVTESQTGDKQPLSVSQTYPTALCTHILLTQEPSQLASAKQSPHLPVAVLQMGDMQSLLLSLVAPEAHSASAAHGIFWVKFLGQPAPPYAASMKEMRVWCGGRKHQ